MFLWSITIYKDEETEMKELRLHRDVQKYGISW